MGRQRHCGWCYGRGHNRSTCEQYTERMKEYAEDEVKENQMVERNGGEHLRNYQQYQKCYAKRIKSDTLLDGTKLDAPIQRRRKSTRTCSYCGEAGHNRRSCAAFDKKKESLIKATSDYRKAIKEQLESSGWGIGALVAGLDRDGEIEDVYMVTEVHLESPSYLTMLRKPDEPRGTTSLKLVNTTPAPHYYWSKQRELLLPPLEASRVPKSIKKYVESYGGDYDYIITRLDGLKDVFESNYKLVSGTPQGIEFPRGWTGAVSSSKATGMEEHFKEMEANTKWQSQRNAKREDYGY